jgi:hypothetical protein
MANKVQPAVICLIFLLTFFTLSKVGGTTLDNDATLHGLNGVGVVIDNINPEIQHDGLDPNQIRTDVETRLRKAGIQVLTGSEYRKESDLPYLGVNVSAVKSQKLGLYAYHIAIEVYQLMTLNRDRNIVSFSNTWSTGSTGMVDTANFSKNVKEKIGGALDRFIEAYSAVNPKK